MVTGKLRRFEGVRRRAPGAFSRNPGDFRKDIRLALKLWLALGGWLPAACRDIWICPGWFLPGRTGTRTAIWRHKNLLRVYLNDTKLIGRTRLVRRTSANNCRRSRGALLRGVNSMDKPNGRLVLVSFTHYCAFTPSLSTRWSFWALQGDLILERASRLYAFSGYHNRTSLPSRALGRTTGTQEVRPSRSSRTKDSPPQISYAHSR